MWATPTPVQQLRGSAFSCTSAVSMSSSTPAPFTIALLTQSHHLPARIQHARQMSDAASCPAAVAADSRAAVWRSGRIRCGTVICAAAPATQKLSSSSRGGSKQQRQPDGQQPAHATKRDRYHSLITGFPFPLGPFFERQTLRYEVVKGKIWTFEQPQNLAGSNVHTNVRMTAIKLKSGGLLIYAPIAPTRECVALVKELGLPVEHILLPTFAYEHKVYVGPFSRKFPDAQIYVAPEQWSFPLRLPSAFFGIFRAITLRAGETYPWSDELDHRILTINISKGVGPYCEVAMFHKASRSLLLVDSAVAVPPQPPPIIPQWALTDAGGSSFFVRLLYGDNTEQQDALEADTANRRGEAAAEQQIQLRGWMRMCLQVLFFAPVNLLEPEESFRRFVGRLIVSPVVRVLVFSKTPSEVAAWVDDIASSWQFRQIIPCHLQAPISAGPADLRAAFAFAYELAGRPLPLPAPAAGPGPFTGLRQAFASLTSGLNGSGHDKGAAAGGITRAVGGKEGSGGDDLFDPKDLKALQTLSSTLRKAGVTIDDPQ